MVDKKKKKIKKVTSVIPDNIMSDLYFFVTPLSERNSNKSAKYN